MSAATDLLVDGFSRVHDAIHAAVEGLDEEALTRRLDPAANTIGWLAWHLTRVQDDHVADVAGWEQEYIVGGWKERFGLPFGMQVGYGQDSEQVAEVKGVSAEDLLAYYDAVHARTIEYVRSLSDEDLERIVDKRWNPPVTLGVRLVSVINDDLQHAGQAAFVRGCVTRLS